MQYLEFEKPIATLETKIGELERIPKSDVAIDEEIKRLKQKARKLLKDTYSNLNAWQTTQVARHPDRPHFSDYVEGLFDDFQELSGDRVFGNDHAIVGGLAKFRGQSVVIMGHEKGNSTQSRIKHNFGMAHPEGYRKAARLMDLADRFNLPVLSFPDTAGAYPGKGGEERGQAEAIARSTQKGLKLGVPFITLIIGEGMSGGAIGIAAANKVLIMENAIYSVISPEGCASILYRDALKANIAAEAMGIVPATLLENGIVDGIVKEPVGGAHRDPEAAISSVGAALDKALKSLKKKTPDQLRKHRRDRFYKIGKLDLTA